MMVVTIDEPEVIPWKVISSYMWAYDARSIRPWYHALDLGVASDRSCLRYLLIRCLPAFKKQIEEFFYRYFLAVIIVRVDVGWVFGAVLID